MTTRRLVTLPLLAFAMVAATVPAHAQTFSCRLRISLAIPLRITLRTV